MKVDFGPEYFAADRHFVSGSAIAFLKGKMGSADGKREREGEKTSTSVSPEGKEGRRRVTPSDARKTQLNLNAAEKSRRQWKKMASSAVPCVSLPTSNCEMARKQESPKEINRPRPDYLWLVGIQSKEGKRVFVPTASWTVLMSSLKEPTTSPCWRLRRYLLRWCITWRYYIHSERALTARNQGDSDKRCSLAFVLGTSGLAEWY